ncbi:MAG: APC family permease [archaeon]
MTHPKRIRTHPEHHHKRKREHKEITLRRDLGLLQATSCGVGIISGAGIYVLIGSAAGLAGNSVWLSFLIASVVALFTAFSYAELSSIFPKDAGEYVYAEHAFGKKLAHLVGWLILSAGIISAAVVAIGFGSYFSALFGTPVLAPAIAMLAILSYVNFIGVRQSANLNVIFTIIEVGGLIAIIVLALTSIGSVSYTEMPNGFPGVFSAAALIFFAFIGFESVVKLSEETKNPEKVIPQALLLSIAITTILYIFVGISAVSVMGWENLAASKAPLADVAASVLGTKAFLVLGIVALISTANTVLITLLSTSRIAYGMSHARSLPSVLSRIHNKHRTPWVAILCILIISILFMLGGDLNLIAELTNFTIFVTFILVNLSLIVLRYKSHHYQGKFRAPLNIGRFPVTALLGIFMCLFLIMQLQRFVIEGGIILILIGFVFYKWYEFFESVEIKVRYRK